MYIKKKIVILFSLIIQHSLNIQAQSRLAFSNTTTYMVMRDGVFLVIDNPNGNAIVPNAGRIVSENETNRIRWYIGGNTGIYTIPFADNAGAGAGFGNNAQTGDAGITIPFTLQISAGGVGAGGYIDFSTYDGPNWDNNTYRPSMVTHMAQFLSPNAANHSAKAIDRFWVINAQNYSTKPSVGNMTFTYIDNEWTAAGNTFTSENVLGAQRFNNNLNKWGDMWPLQASINTASNVLTTGPVSAANFFAAWTLSDINDPLPVELLHFTARCEDGNILLQWATASEINNQWFILEKSINGSEWTQLATLPGNGNSNVIQNYDYIDNISGETNYYRLWQQDYDGNLKLVAQTAASCPVKNNQLSIQSVYNQGNQTIISVNIPDQGEYFVEIFDATGKLIYLKHLPLMEGNQIIKPEVYIAKGIYILRVYNEKYSDRYKFHGNF
ncbi:MAG: hypothetical protein KatS3mg034_0341 [Vicingaceae bacterium]|nr:MAG: hypothetical protein KatS3mg034_0341 [Vicingaceae bacterium]